MKKWAAYASLIEQKGTLAQMRYEKSKVPRPHISGDQAALIEARLSFYDGSPLRVTYYEDGFIREETLVITKIDPLRHLIEHQSGTIAFKDLLSIAD
ncbi:MAG: YolD-like family protein [Bacilli bacterium]